MVKIGCSKYKKLFKTLIRNIFHDIYCRAHKTAFLTAIQHTVPYCHNAYDTQWVEFLSRKAPLFKKDFKPLCPKIKVNPLGQPINVII